MKKFQILSIVTLFSILAVFAGCGATKSTGPDMAGEKVIQESLVNVYYDVQTYNYAINLKGNVKAPAGQTPESLDFDLSLNGLADSSTPTVPQFTMSAVATGAMDAQNYALDAELRLDASNFYAIVNSLSGADEVVPAEMVSLFLGQWWSMPVPAGTFNDVSFGSGVAEENMTEQELALKNLIKETTFFKDVKYVGEEEMGGVSTYHYTAVLDKVALKKFMVDSTAVMGNPEPTETELKDLDDMLATIELSSDFYVGVDDMIMRGMKGDFTLSSQDGGVVTLNFGLELSKLNEAVVIEAPAGAKEFDPMMLLGGAVPTDVPEDLPGLSDEEFADLKSDFDSLE